MFNRTRYAIAFVGFVTSLDKEGRQYRKDRKARRIEREEYEAMIAESQAKIGPYIPTACPVQIWA